MAGQLPPLDLLSPSTDPLALQARRMQRLADAQPPWNQDGCLGRPTPHRLFHDGAWAPQHVDGSHARHRLVPCRVRGHEADVRRAGRKHVLRADALSGAGHHRRRVHDDARRARVVGDDGSRQRGQ